MTRDIGPHKEARTLPYLTLPRMVCRPWCCPPLRGLRVFACSCSAATAHLDASSTPSSSTPVALLTHRSSPRYARPALQAAFPLLPKAALLPLPPLTSPPPQLVRENMWGVAASSRSDAHAQSAPKGAHAHAQRVCLLPQEKWTLRAVVASARHIGHLGASSAASAPPPVCFAVAVLRSLSTSSEHP